MGCGVAVICGVGVLAKPSAFLLPRSGLDRHREDQKIASPAAWKELCGFWGFWGLGPVLRWSAMSEFDPEVAKKFDELLTACWEAPQTKETDNSWWKCFG